MLEPLQLLARADDATRCGDALVAAQQLVDILAGRQLLFAPDVAPVAAVKFVPVQNLAGRQQEQPAAERGGAAVLDFGDVLQGFAADRLHEVTYGLASAQHCASAHANKSLERRQVASDQLFDCAPIALPSRQHGFPQVLVFLVFEGAHRAWRTLRSARRTLRSAPRWTRRWLLVRSSSGSDAHSSCTAAGTSVPCALSARIHACRSRRWRIKVFGVGFGAVLQRAAVGRSAVTHQADHLGKRLGVVAAAFDVRKRHPVPRLGTQVVQLGAVRVVRHPDRRRARPPRGGSPTMRPGRYDARGCPTS